MNYEITEEQIKELAELTGFESKINNKLKKWFPEVFETKLEVGKWYKNEDYDNLVFMVEKFKEQNFESKFTTFAKGYGFKFNSLKEWFDDLYFSDTRKFILATDSEVEEALKNEAVKKYKVGDLVKCAWEEKSHETIKHLNFTYLEEFNSLVSNEGKEDSISLFLNGKWAEIVKTYTKEEAEKLLNAKIID